MVLKFDLMRGPFVESTMVLSVKLDDQFSNIL